MTSSPQVTNTHRIQHLPIVLHSFGQFYRENYPKKYREWQSGRWQHDIAYRDSLIRAHSLDRLKHLHEDK